MPKTREGRTGRRAQGADRGIRRPAAHRVPRPHGVRDHRAPPFPRRGRHEVRGGQEHLDATGRQRRRRRGARGPARGPVRGGVRRRRPGGGGQVGRRCREEVPHPGAQGRVHGRQDALGRRREGARLARVARGHAVEDRRLDEVGDVEGRGAVRRRPVEVPVGARGVQGEGARRGSAAEEPLAADRAEPRAEEPRPRSRGRAQAPSPRRATRRRDDRGAERLEAAARKRRSSDGEDVDGRPAGAVQGDDAARAVGVHQAVRGDVRRDGGGGRAGHDGRARAAVAARPLPRSRTSST